jgi:hypothetical protein
VRLWDNPLPEARNHGTFHINGQSDSSLKRKSFPEPHVPSRGSQARGTRLTDKHELKANKIAKTTGILNKTRNFLKIDTLTTLYNTLIYPYLYYGNTVWANNYPSKLKKILKIQKRAVRIITLSSYNAKSASTFSKNKTVKNCAT